MLPVKKKINSAVTQIKSSCLS